MGKRVRDVAKLRPCQSKYSIKADGAFGQPAFLLEYGDN